MVDKYQRAALAVTGLWLLLCLATINYNGPFFDEATHITAGLRTLEGKGVSDGYLVWFTGSLFWPALAGLAYKAGGLIGARIAALSLATVGFLALVRATQNLFGSKASFWAAVTVALSGPFLALARLAVYDAPALAGVAVSLMAVTELARSDNRAWLLVASGAVALATLSKYPVVLMVLPLLGVVLSLRSDKALLDIGILGMTSLALVLAFFLPVQSQAGQTVSWHKANAPTFGITASMAWYARIYRLGAPFLLALVGGHSLKDRRGLMATCILSLAIWPAYHVWSGNPVSEYKHLVFSLLFVYPLAGVALSTLWQRAGGKALVAAIVVGLAALGFTQLEQDRRAWPDAREAAAYLVRQVQPGEKLLINESWPYIMYLYAAGRIQSPWDVFDVYRITHGESTLDLCEYDWFVDVEGSYTWPEAIAAAVKRCDRFEPVYTDTSMVANLGPDLRYGTYPVRVTIWRNVTEMGASGDG
jgi:hypothetical protein